MKEKDDTTLIEVFTGSPWEAELVKGLLESSGIQAATQEAIMASLAPYISTGVAVMVNEEDYVRAVEIIENREEVEKSGNEA